MALGGENGLGGKVLPASACARSSAAMTFWKAMISTVSGEAVWSWVVW